MEKAQPNYELSNLEFKELEQELVSEVNSRNLNRGDFKEEEIIAVWLSPYSKYTNLLRSRESEYFPEVKDLDGKTEDKTKFFVIVDMRENINRLVHATTLSVFEKSNDEMTGFITIDELINDGKFTCRNFVEYYNKKGVDLARCFSVDTNFRIGDRAPDIDGLKPSDIAYLTLFQALKRSAEDVEDCSIFASINQDSIKSFGRIGLEVLPLMGISNLEALGIDVDYYPVEIPYSRQNRDLFFAMNYEVPELNLT